MEDVVDSASFAARLFKVEAVETEPLDESSARFGFEAGHFRRTEARIALPVPGRDRIEDSAREQQQFIVHAPILPRPRGAVARFRRLALVARLAIETDLSPTLSCASASLAHGKHSVRGSGDGRPERMNQMFFLGWRRGWDSPHLELIMTAFRFESRSG